MKVCVVGLGKIGLPLASNYATKGLTVIGCDIAPQVVEAVNAGRSPIDREPGLSEAVAQSVAAGRLRATTDTTQAVDQSAVVVVIVPLLIKTNCQPDFKSIDSATLAIARGLHRDHLVIYETTLPVGTKLMIGEVRLESDLTPRQSNPSAAVVEEGLEATGAPHDVGR